MNRTPQFAASHLTSTHAPGLSALPGIATTARAATFHWKGGGGNNDWSNAAPALARRRPLAA